MFLHSSILQREECSSSSSVYFFPLFLHSCFKSTLKFFFPCPLHIFSPLLYCKKSKLAVQRRSALLSFFNSKPYISRWGIWCSVHLLSYSQVASPVKVLPIHICAGWLTKQSFFSIIVYLPLENHLQEGSAPSLWTSIPYAASAPCAPVRDSGPFVTITETAQGWGEAEWHCKSLFTGSTNSGCRLKNCKRLKHSTHHRITVKLLWLSHKYQFWPQQSWKRNAASEKAHISISLLPVLCMCPQNHRSVGTHACRTSWALGWWF